MQGRILEVLDDVCESIPLELPAATKKSKKLVKEAVRSACSRLLCHLPHRLTRICFFACQLVCGSAPRSWGFTKTS